MWKTSGRKGSKSTSGAARVSGSFAAMDGAKQAVKEHWEAEPCGTGLTSAEYGSREFYAELERHRYEVEPFIRPFAEFERWRDKDVLEVGVGAGTDFVQFARAGARLHGVDLTQASIDLVGQRLALDGYDANIRVADAERLPFDDGSFDLVYSWGVLHHTPDTEAAIAEVRRVLRDGGEARIMLYARHSWVALALWARYALLVGRPWRSLSDVVANHMESPGTKAYTDNELRSIFAGFADVRIERFVTPYDRRVAGPAVRLGGARFGWFAGIRAVR
jgi:ubiquinone/menaquinone biosynthesis C-methylase UbiE